MQFSTLPLLLPLLPFTLAQYGGGGGGSSSSTSSAAAAPAATTTSSAAAVQTVTVGNGTLGFSPNVITAAVGSMIEFVFFPPVHSVVQSSFANPCVPLELNGTGFFSGGFNTTSGMNPNAFTITVNDTNPIWFYCGFPGHCELGMAGVVNAPSDGSATLPQYQAAASSVTSPPSPKVVQGGSVGPVKAASTGSPSGSSSSSSSSASASPTKSAGVEARGGLQWVVLAITGIIAVGFGGLIV